MLIRLKVAFNLLIHTAMVFSGASYIALLAPAFLGCAYAVQFFYLRTSRQVRHLDLEGKTPLYTQFKDIANGLIHIRSFGWASETFDECLELLDSSQTPFYALFCVQRWLSVVMELSQRGYGAFVSRYSPGNRDSGCF